MFENTIGFRMKLEPSSTCHHTKGMTSNCTKQRLKRPSPWGYDDTQTYSAINLADSDNKLRLTGTMQLSIPHVVNCDQINTVTKNTYDI